MIERHQGQVIKFEARTCHVLSPGPWPAAQAVMELGQAFEQPNAAADDALSIRISCGIEPGEVLVGGSIRPERLKVRHPGVLSMKVTPPGKVRVLGVSCCCSSRCGAPSFR